jgi:hypothetical protein
MTTIVRPRRLFGVAQNAQHGSSNSLCCDHCRAKLGYSPLRYWRMRFCSAACVSAYRQRLSGHTQQKIYEIDSRRPVWKAAG